MPEPVEVTEVKLLGDIGQKWQGRFANTEYHDQFGFSIYKTGIRWELYHNGNLLGKVNKLHTAKMLSRIWLNDAVIYKRLT